MRSPEKMVELIAVAKTFSVRPSSLIYGLTSYEAYCFDSACLIYVEKLSKGVKPVELDDDASKWL